MSQKPEANISSTSVPEPVEEPRPVAQPRRVQRTRRNLITGELESEVLVVDAWMTPLGKEQASDSPGWREVGPDPKSPAPQPARQAFSTTGNAYRLLQRHMEDIRYNVDANQWLVYDQTHWRPCDAKGILPYAIKVAKDGLQEELVSIPETYVDHSGKAKDNPAYRKFAGFMKVSQTYGELMGMINIASGIPDKGYSVRVRSGAFDTHPRHLNTTTGVVNLRDGTLDLHAGDGLPEGPRIRYQGGNHTRSLLLTKVCPVAYDPRLDPEKACPRWLQMLKDAFYGDEERVTFLQQAFGISLIGYAPKKAFFLLGPQNSGKTTMLDVFGEVLGRDFSTKLPTLMFLKMRTESNARQLGVSLAKGKRFVYASETDARGFDAPFFKEFLGGGKQTGRAHREQWEEYEAQYTCWIDTNTLPYFQPDDDALWGRVAVVTFDRSYYHRSAAPEGCTDYIDPGLKDYLLKHELPGILAWAVQGAVQWNKAGELVLPTSVHRAVEEHRENCRKNLVQWQHQEHRPGGTDGDEGAVDIAAWTPVVNQWLEEQYERGEGYRVVYTGLYEAFLAWCKNNTHRVRFGGIDLKGPEFRQVLDSLGITSHVSHGKAYRLGIRPRTRDLGDILT